MNKLARNVSILAYCFLCPAYTALAQAEYQPLREYKIKAAYIYNLTKFINWPEAKDQSDRIEICQSKNNPLAEQLALLNTRTAKGNPITVVDVAPESDLSQCHILVVNSDINLDWIPPDDSGNAILTVGEDVAFLEQGGLIALVVTENTVKLHINLNQAKLLGFEISGNLLEIAKIVE